MINNDLLYGQNIQLTHSADSLTTDRINSFIPQPFEGKDAFIQFYLQNNGGIFEKHTFICRDKFYEVHSNEYRLMDVESFYYIPVTDEQDENEYLSSLIKKWNERRKTSDKVRNYFQTNFPDVWEAGKSYRNALSIYAETHFPFASSAAGHDYWVDMDTGQIEYIEPINFLMHKVNVAPSFYEFCTSLQCS